MTRVVLLSLALAGTLSGCGGGGPGSSEVTRILKTRLGSLKGTTAAVRGERLIARETVARFYEGRDSKPAWKGDDAGQLGQAIRGAERDGLNPEAYHLAAIESLLVQRKASSTAAIEADLDILITDALAGLIDDLRFGHVLPRSLDPRWNVDPREGAPPPEQELAHIAGAGSVAAAIDAARPKHFIYAGLVEALARLREIEAKGGWGTVLPGAPIKPGGASPRIPAVRARLIATGELARGQDASPRYDAGLRKAVVLFQERHRLDANGVIDKDLVDAMNLSTASRIGQLRVNLERARWVVGGLSDDFLLVNLPAFKAYVIRGGKNVWEGRTQIGEEAKQTPTFRADMRTVVFNPDWTVPPTMLAEEVIPGMRKSKDYLSRMDLVILDAGDKEVDPGSVDWGDAEPGAFPYTLRQRPALDNALGRVKFLFPNKHSIYIHDTPSRTLFDAERRTFSHGCIRLEHPLDLARLLLSGQDGWNARKIDEVLATGETKNVDLDTPLPVLIVYWTVSVGASGEIRYMQDFYDLDPPALAALDAPSRRP